MNCPICDSSSSIEVTTQSGGYAKGIRECTNCEAVWICEDTDITVLKAEKAAA